MTNRPEERIVREVSGLFSKHNKKIREIEEIKSKEKFFPAIGYSVALIHLDFAWFRKWNVVVTYRGEILFSKGFRKYEDALEFYKVTVDEVKKRLEVS